MPIKVELHCHTCYSSDSLVSIQDIQRTCQKKGIQRVAITDHNTIRGALEANILDPSMFIVSEEIKTTQGELLGYFIKEEVPRGLSPMETIEILHSQGAFISVSHPFDEFRSGHWKADNLLNILPYIDAIEVFNSRCLLPKFNRLAKEFAQQNHLLGTVGSDSHHTSEIGAATLILQDFYDAESFKTALLTAQQNLHLSGFWVHFYSRKAARQKSGSNKSL